MIENLVYFSPLFVLFFGAMVLLYGTFYSKDERRCFRLSKTFLLVSFVLAIIFYNKSPMPNMMTSDLFSFLFKLVIYLLGFAILYLSRKWYANMGSSGYSFCGCLLVAIGSGIFLITSTDLYLTLGSGIVLTICNYLLFKFGDVKKEVSTNSRVYAVTAIVMTLLMSVAGYFLTSKSGGTSYYAISSYLVLNSENVLVLLAVGILTLGFVFWLGIAPMHFWFTETMGQVILPVFAYFMLIPVGANWAALIRFNAKALSSISDFMSVGYGALAFLSIGIGAIGTCSGKNIRKIFAYSSVYHLGIVFLMMQIFSAEAVWYATIYLLIYLLAMYGICASLFGIKSRGEYLFTLSDFEGVAYKRPYIAAVMSMLLFSLIGFPPFLGFLGMLAVLNEMVANRYYGQLLYFMIMAVVIASSYLQIIKTLYFEKSKEVFDRADTGIYVAILLNVVLMMAIMLKPQIWLTDLSFMSGVIFE